MAASVDQPDTTSNVTNAGSFPNQPIPPGHDGTNDSANPTTIGNTTAKPLPGTPRTGGRVTDMSPTVASRPNPASASNTNRGQVQKAPSRPMSPLERSSTGLEMIGYDPIRGDIPQHQMFMLDVDVDEDVRGVPKRPGGRNGVGRLSAYRPRSMMSRGEGTMAGPGSRRGSRMMIDAPDVIPAEKTVQDRLQPTIDAATAERDKYRRQARRQRLLINGAIGIQVIVGALTTGVAAAGSAHLGAAVAVLGGISTILASYLAKVRGSGEPELSSIRTRELNSFLREVHTFIVDDGDKLGKEYDEKITTYRERFENIIKTEGEDSGPPGSGGHRRLPSTFYPTPHAPLPAHVMAGYQGTLPVQPGLGAHVVDEKQQMWKNERVIGGVV